MCVAAMAGAMVVSPAVAEAAPSKAPAAAKKPSAKRSQACPALRQVHADANRVEAANLRAAASLFAASQYERAGLYGVAESTARDIVAGKLRVGADSHAAAKRYLAAASSRLSASQRVTFVQFVASLVQGTFQAIVDASIQQMEAYGELLASVSKGVDEFTQDNASESNVGRAHLLLLAGALSNAHHGSAACAAARLDAQTKAAKALLQRSDILAANRARGIRDLLTRKARSKPQRRAVKQALLVARSGEDLIRWLATNAAQLKTEQSASKLRTASERKRLKRLVARFRQARGSSQAAKLRKRPKPIPVRAACFDERQKPRPCIVRPRK